MIVGFDGLGSLEADRTDPWGRNKTSQRSRCTDGQVSSHGYQRASLGSFAVCVSDSSAMEIGSKSYSHGSFVGISISEESHSIHDLMDGNEIRSYLYELLRSISSANSSGQTFIRREGALQKPRIKAFVVLERSTEDTSSTHWATQ